MPAAAIVNGLVMMSDGHAVDIDQLLDDATRYRKMRSLACEDGDLVDRLICAEADAMILYDQFDEAIDEMLSEA